MPERTNIYGPEPRSENYVFHVVELGCFCFFFLIVTSTLVDQSKPYCITGVQNGHAILSERDYRTSIYTKKKKTREGRGLIAQLWPKKERGAVCDPNAVRIVSARKPGVCQGDPRSRISHAQALGVTTTIFQTRGRNRLELSRNAGLYILITDRRRQSAVV